MDQFDSFNEFQWFRHLRKLVINGEFPQDLGFEDCRLLANHLFAGISPLESIFMNRELWIRAGPDKGNTSGGALFDPTEWKDETW